MSYTYGMTFNFR